MCPATSRTFQPSHSDGTSHCCRLEALEQGHGVLAFGVHQLPCVHGPKRRVSAVTTTELPVGPDASWEALGNPYLAGLYAPVRRGAHRRGAAGHRRAAARPRRRVPAQRAQPAARSGRVATTGSTATACCTPSASATARASYRNRWVRTRGFAAEDGADAALFNGVMENPSANPQLGLRLPLKDSANTDLVCFRDRVLALWYLAGEPYALDATTLDTIGVDDFGGTRTCQVSAHAKVDEATGELMFFDYGPMPPYMRYGVVGPDGAVTHLVDIDLPGPRLPHDMAITANHSILMDLPLVADPVAAKQGRHKIMFDSSMPARFGVIPRHGAGSEVRWFEADPCYVYHSVNAWEEGDEIVLDLCRVTKPAPRGDAVGPLAKMLSYLRLDAHLYRYRFNLRTGAVQRGATSTTTTPSSPPWTPASSGTPDPVRLQHAHLRRAHAALRRHRQVRHADRRHRPPLVRPGPVGERGAVRAPRPAARPRTTAGWCRSCTTKPSSAPRSSCSTRPTWPPARSPRVLLPARVPIGFHATWVRGDQLSACTRELVGLRAQRRPQRGVVLLAVCSSCGASACACGT